MSFIHRSKVSIVFSLVVLATILSAFGGIRIHPVHAATYTGWLTYLNSDGRTGFNGAETIINSTSAPNLALKWATTSSGCLNSPGGPLSISVQPVVSESLQLLFWGSWDGCEHATDLNGNQVWATFIGQTINPNCGSVSTLGVASTATVITEIINGVSTPVILVGGGDVNFYALNALTGTVIWKTQLGTATGSFLWSSPVVYKGDVYEGLSSQSDCPLVQGKFFQLSVSSGAIRHSFNVVPGGCIGGSVWGSPTIDVATGTVYFATGNPGTCSQTELYAPALVELTAPNLQLVGYWQVPTSQQVFDSDFGSTPTLFQATISGVLTSLVGIENKNGIYYTFARGNLSAGPIWQATIASGSITTQTDIFSPSAWDGKTLYVGGGHATISGTLCQGTGGSLRALDPATGIFLWQDCFTSGAVIGAVTEVPGVVVVGAGNALQVVTASSGQILFTYNEIRRGAALDAAAISNGLLYVGDSNGNLYAFAP